MTFNVFSQKNKQKWKKENKEANYLASVGIFFSFFLLLLLLLQTAPE